MASPVVVTTIPFMSCLRRRGNRKQICFCCCTATYLGNNNSNNNNNAVASIQREIAMASKHLPKVAATSFFDSHETIKFDKKKFWVFDAMQEGKDLLRIAFFLIATQRFM